MSHTTSAREVVDAVEDAHFPAGKDELIDAARRSGASQEVVAALRGIPPEEYANRDGGGPVGAGGPGLRPRPEPRTARRAGARGRPAGPVPAFARGAQGSGARGTRPLTTTGAAYGAQEDGRQRAATRGSGP
ncbi:DUF2795 domain-containing protein [Streptomyces coeruleorubidus]|uniref:DUF2795 domain-containing protein n=1 Tax=Streptomyces coeruleorubidus TaxID=116188 RepID=UPI0033ADDD2B